MLDKNNFFLKKFLKRINKTLEKKLKIFNTSIIVRHNNLIINKIFKNIWKHFDSGIERDQVLVSYFIQKFLNNRVGYIDQEKYAFKQQHVKKN